MKLKIGSIQEEKGQKIIAKSLKRERREKERKNYCGHELRAEDERRMGNWGKGVKGEKAD